MFADFDTVYNQKQRISVLVFCVNIGPAFD